ncbi:MAG: class I SAM-dependent methyltransferase [Deltaproteobacteria bacterium]|nr:class I SAM-dependent methyltransferase [Deltaproteobacteria bacterium]
MHISNAPYEYEHELTENDFSSCCKDCRNSVAIIKPHITAFARRIRGYTPQALEALTSEELFRLYQLLDDLVHMDAGEHLADLILNDPDIQHELPIIRSYYRRFFRIHETHLAMELLKSTDPWETLKTFPLYSRYVTLVRNQVKAMDVDPGVRLAFIGSGPVPITLILMSHLYGLASVGLDSSSQAVEVSKNVVECLGLAKEIEIVHGNHCQLKQHHWDVVLVSALAEPKARIFQSLREILRERGNGLVIFRTYTGMRAVLYEPVQASDIQGFRIVKVIYPTGRVNNTTIVAQLDG